MDFISFFIILYYIFSLMAVSYFITEIDNTLHFTEQVAIMILAPAIVLFGAIVGIFKLLKRISGDAN